MIDEILLFILYFIGMKIGFLTYVKYNNITEDYILSTKVISMLFTLFAFLIISVFTTTFRLDNEMQVKPGAMSFLQAHLLILSILIGITVVIYGLFKLNKDLALRIIKRKE